MVDRRPVGFVLTILVITTVVSLLIFEVAEEEAVNILASRTPANIPGGRPSSPSFSIDLMAARNLPDLRVGFHFLRKNPGNLALVKLWNETSGRQFEDLLSNVPRLSNLKEQLDILAPALSEGEAYKVYEIDRGLKGKLHVLDLTDVMAVLAGEEQLKTIYTVYAFDVDEEDKVSVYGGYRDFFFRRDTVITEIRYTTPSESICFRSMNAPAGLGECRTISEAPAGLIHIQDISEGDQIHFEVSLDTIGMFGHLGIYEIITTETGLGPGPILTEWIGGRGT